MWSNILYVRLIAFKYLASLCSKQNGNNESVVWAEIFLSFLGGFKKKCNFAAESCKKNKEYDGNITSCLLYMQTLYG